MPGPPASARARSALLPVCVYPSLSIPQFVHIPAGWQRFHQLQWQSLPQSHAPLATSHPHQFVHPRQLSCCVSCLTEMHRVHVELGRLVWLHSGFWNVRLLLPQALPLAMASKAECLPNPHGAVGERQATAHGELVSRTSLFVWRTISIKRSTEPKRDARLHTRLLTLCT